MAKTIGFLPFYFLFLLSFFPISTVTAAESPFTAAELILLNCGADGPSKDAGNRSWDSDDGSKYTQTNSAAVSSTFKAFQMDPSASEVPYAAARVIHSPFTYTFPLTSGQKFLRLYFYPNTYNNYNTSQSFFSVTANEFTLLTNFSAFLYSMNTSAQPRAFSKEFIINIDSSQTLRLIFTPNSNSFAFINGIEIVSIPDKLYFKGNDVPVKYVEGSSVMYLENNKALENLYRLNVGGGRVEIQDDSGPTRGMFRAWSDDDSDYIFGYDYGFTPHREDIQINYTSQTPSYSAPAKVYTSARAMANNSISLEWSFPVDSGFHYLLRFHFCEFTLDVTLQNQRVFTIYINGEVAEIEADVIKLADGPKIPIFLDYIKLIPDDGSRGKQNLRVFLTPTMRSSPKYHTAMLNGLEIFKLSDQNGSLAAANPELRLDSSPENVPVISRKKKSGGSVIYAVIGSVIGVLAVLAAVSFLILRRRRKTKESTSVTTSSWVPVSIGSKSDTRRTSGTSNINLPSDLCRNFSLGEILAATRNFDDNFVIGRGGFGNVYKGLIDNAAAAVAIKRLNPSSKQGAREFLTEIEMLSKLRHLHLVSLIGFCEDDGEMILVYDYMARGTLRDHLYNSQNSPLTWLQRLQICLGAAKGLEYLHTGAKHTIIHRDVKSTNILLDEKWVAKMSDFGLSKVGPAAGHDTHVSTVVKGSFGYLDPEYYKRQQLTIKSDVYSLGVVLFEALCARPAMIPSLPREQVNLAEWAKFCFRKGTLYQIIDPNLKGQIAPECLRKFAETAVSCLEEKGIDRPSMSDVVWSLDFAIQLQKSADGGGGDKFAAVKGSLQLPLLGSGATNTTDEEDFTRSSEHSGSKSRDFSTSGSERLKSGDVFSEINNPLGR